MEIDLVYRYAVGNINGRKSIVTLGKDLEIDGWWVKTYYFTEHKYNMEFFFFHFFADRHFRKIVKTYELKAKTNVFDRERYR